MVNERAIEILEEQKSILLMKGIDYQNPNSQVCDDDYFRFDEIPGLQMMYAKLMRYASTMTSDGIHYEAADDSLRDLINYCARTIAYNERKEIEEIHSYHKERE